MKSRLDNEINDECLRKLFINAIKMDLDDMEERIAYSPNIKLLCADPTPQQKELVIENKLIIIIHYPDSKEFLIGFNKVVDGIAQYNEVTLEHQNLAHDELLKKLKSFTKSEFGLLTGKGLAVNGTELDYGKSVELQTELNLVITTEKGEGFKLPDLDIKYLRDADNLKQAIFGGKETLGIRVAKFVTTLHDCEYQTGMAEQLAPKTWKLYNEHLVNKAPQAPLINPPFVFTKIFANTRIDDLHHPLPEFKRLTVDDVRKLGNQCEKPVCLKYVILPDGELIITKEWSEKIALTTLERIEFSNYEPFNTETIDGKKYRVHQLSNNDKVIYHKGVPQWKKVPLKHPEIAGLRDVVAAGDAYVMNGKFITEHPSGRFGIDNWTGHYCVSGPVLKHIVERHFYKAGFTEALGCFRDRVAVRLGGKTGRMPSVVHDAHFMNLPKTEIPLQIPYQSKPLKSLASISDNHPLTARFQGKSLHHGEFIDYPWSIGGRQVKVSGTCRYFYDDNKIAYVKEILTAKFTPVKNASFSKLAAFGHVANGLLSAFNVYANASQSYERHPELPIWLHIDLGIGAAAAQGGVWCGVGAVGGAPVLIPASMISLAAMGVEDLLKAHEAAWEKVEELGGKPEVLTPEQQWAKNGNYYPHPDGPACGIDPEIITQVYGFKDSSAVNIDPAVMSKLSSREVLALDPNVFAENMPLYFIGKPINDFMDWIAKSFVGIPDKHLPQNTPTAAPNSETEKPAALNIRQQASILPGDLPKTSSNASWRNIFNPAYAPLASASQQHGESESQSFIMEIPSPNGNGTTIVDILPLPIDEDTNSQRFVVKIPLSDENNFGTPAFPFSRTDSQTQDDDVKFPDVKGYNKDWTNYFGDWKQHAGVDHSIPIASVDEDGVIDFIRKNCNIDMYYNSVDGVGCLTFSFSLEEIAAACMISAPVAIFVGTIAVVAVVINDAFKRRKIRHEEHRMKRQVERVQDDMKDNADLASRAAEKLQAYFEETDPKAKQQLWHECCDALVAVEKHNHRARDRNEQWGKKEIKRVTVKHSDKSHPHYARKPTQKFIEKEALPFFKKIDRKMAKLRTALFAGRVAALGDEDAQTAQANLFNQAGADYIAGTIDKDQYETICNDYIKELKDLIHDLKELKKSYHQTDYTKRREKIVAKMLHLDKPKWVRNANEEKEQIKDLIKVLETEITDLDKVINDNLQLRLYEDISKDFILGELSVPEFKKQINKLYEIEKSKGNATSVLDKNGLTAYIDTKLIWKSYLYNIESTNFVIYDFHHFLSEALRNSISNAISKYVSGNIEVTEFLEAFQLYTNSLTNVIQQLKELEVSQTKIKAEIESKSVETAEKIPDEVASVDELQLTKDLIKQYEDELLSVEQMEKSNLKLRQYEDLTRSLMANQLSVEEYKTHVNKLYTAEKGESNAASVLDNEKLNGVTAYLENNLTLKKYHDNFEYFTEHFPKLDQVRSQYLKDVMNEDDLKSYISRLKDAIAGLKQQEMIWAINQSSMHPQEQEAAQPDAPPSTTREEYWNQKENILVDYVANTILDHTVAKIHSLVKIENRTAEDKQALQALYAKFKTVWASVVDKNASVGMLLYFAGQTHAAGDYKIAQPMIEDAIKLSKDPFDAYLLWIENSRADGLSAEELNKRIDEFLGSANTARKQAILKYYASIVNGTREAILQAFAGFLEVPEMEMDPVERARYLIHTYGDLERKDKDKRDLLSSIAHSDALPLFNIGQCQAVVKANLTAINNLQQKLGELQEKLQEITTSIANISTESPAESQPTLDSLNDELTAINTEIDSTEKQVEDLETCTLTASNQVKEGTGQVRSHQIRTALLYASYTYLGADIFTRYFGKWAFKSMGFKKPEEVVRVVAPIIAPLFQAVDAAGRAWQATLEAEQTGDSSYLTAAEQTQLIGMARASEFVLADEIDSVLNHTHVQGVVAAFRLMIAASNLYLYHCYLKEVASVRDKKTSKCPDNFQAWLTQRAEYNRLHGQRDILRGFVEHGSLAMDGVQWVQNALPFATRAFTNNFSISSFAHVRGAINSIVFFPQLADWILGTTQTDGPSTDWYRVLAGTFIRNMNSGGWRTFASMHAHTAFNGFNQIATYAGYVDAVTGPILAVSSKLSPVLMGANLLISTGITLWYVNSEHADARFDHLQKDYQRALDEWLLSSKDAKQKANKILINRISNLIRLIKEEARFFGAEHPHRFILYIDTMVKQHQVANEIEFHAVRRDGNGFFNSVANYTLQTPAELKTLTIQYIKDNKAIFEPFLAAVCNMQTKFGHATQKEIDQAFEAYLSNIKKPGMPIDEIIFRALSAVLKRPIIILNKGEDLTLRSQGIHSLESTSRDDELFKRFHPEQQAGEPIYVQYDRKLQLYNGVRMRMECFFESMHATHLRRRTAVLKVSAQPAEKTNQEVQQKEKNKSILNSAIKFVKTQSINVGAMTKDDRKKSLQTVTSYLASNNNLK